MMDLEATQDDYFNMPTVTEDGEPCGTTKGSMVIGSDDLAERGDHWRGLAMQEREALENLAGWVAKHGMRPGTTTVEGIVAWARSET